MGAHGEGGPGKKSSAVLNRAASKGALLGEGGPGGQGVFNRQSSTGSKVPLLVKVRVVN